MGIESRIIRLPTKSAQKFYASGTSCPSSPAVKKTVRLVVVGAAQTGKSAIINRFLNDQFDERYIPTIENYHRKLFKARGEIYQLEIVDSSGNDPFPASRKLSYFSGDLFLIVGAVDQDDTLVQVLDFTSQILECKISRSVDSNSVPILYAISKIDLPQQKWKTDITDLKKQIASVSTISENLFECSALIPKNIDKVFERIFLLGKLPKFANIDIHRKLCNKYSAGEFNEGMLKSVKNKLKRRFTKDEDDERWLDEKKVEEERRIEKRSASLRTDLLNSRLRALTLNKSLLVDNNENKCIIL